MGVVFRCLLAVSIGLAVAWPSAAEARGADPLAAAVMRSVRHLHVEVAAVKLPAKIITPAQARRAIPKLRVLARDLDRSATVVARVHVTTRRERLAQRDWTMGMRSLARRWRQAIPALRAMAGHRFLTFVRDAEQAARTARHGVHLLRSAQRLLHLRLRAGRYR